MRHHLARAITGATTALSATVAATTANYNLFTALGSPAGIVTAILTIASGATVYSASQATAALIISGFASGSDITVINNGTIVGANGDKGDGGTLRHNGGNGHDGGDAISLGNDVDIDNTYGQILGGGGGGGGGAGWSRAHDPVPPVDGSGGDGGHGAGWATGGIVSKTNGKTGNGGATGGDGGDFGTNGHDGGDTGGNTGGTRGQAGKAVNLNGHVAIWVAGFNSTQVKGAVA